MSVTTTNISTTRVGNGSLVAFDFNMVTYDEAWVSVTLDGWNQSTRNRIKKLQWQRRNSLK